MSKLDTESVLSAVLIEVDGIAAGIAMPDQGRVRFIAIDRRFELLDGSHFSNPMRAEKAAQKLLAAQSPAQMSAERDKSARSVSRAA